MGSGTMPAYDFHVGSLCGHDTDTDTEQCHDERELRVFPMLCFSYGITQNGMGPSGGIMGTFF